MEKIVKIDCLCKEKGHLILLKIFSQELVP